MMKKNILLPVSILMGLLVLVNVGILLALMGGGEASPEGVKMTILFDPNCDECFDASQYQEEMTRLGITIVELEEIDRTTWSGKRLLSKYDITKVPAVIFSEELGENAQIAGAWDRVGTRGKDGSFLLQGTNPPYLDLESGEVKGFVEIIYLDDASCDECYDPALHKGVLERYGMIFSKEETFDISSEEGAALIAQYDITAVPTILLRGDMEIYPAFSQVWTTVGRVAEDGTALFTGMDSLGEPYKELSTGDVVATAA
jgi:hypothetical protein